MAKDSRGFTPLHYAARQGQLSCLQLVLGKSDAYVLSPAEVNEAALYCVTPLLCAALSGNVKCVGVLLAAGARVDAAMYACVQREAPNAEILAVLSDAGVGDPPGTTCDHCGTPQTEQRLRACGSCFAALFCTLDWLGLMAKRLIDSDARRWACAIRVVNDGTMDHRQ